MSQVQVDYFRASSKLPQEQIAASMVEDDVLIECTPHHGYRKGLQGKGFRIYYENPMDREFSTCCLELSSEGCEMHRDKLPMLFKMAADGAIRPSRIDLADHMPLEELETVAQDIKAKKVFKHIRRWKEHNNDEGGYTIDFGSRQSQLCGRAYNKEVESKEERFQGLGRFELELKGETAANAAMWIGRGMLSIEQVFRGLLASVSRDGEDRPGWMAQLVAGASKIIVGLKRHVKSYAATLKWLKRQVAPALRVVHDLDGLDEIIGILKSAKLSRKHVIMREEMFHLMAQRC